MTPLKILSKSLLIFFLLSGPALAVTTTEFNPHTRKPDKVGSGSGGGDNISVNGTAATNADFDDATPAAAAGGVNVKWQKDASATNNISAYILESLLTLSNLGGAVTDSQVPNNITVDLATTATTANAGDSATSFFSSGTIEHERGGLEADVNAYDGLIGITGGATFNQTGTNTQIIIFDGSGAPTSAALSGDVTMTNAGVVTIGADKVALGTDTVNNYVATIADAGNSTVTVANSGTENAAVTLDVIDVNCTGCLSVTELGADSVNSSELNATGVEAELEAVLDLNELQGQIGDAQIAAGAIDGGVGGEIEDNTIDSNDIDEGAQYTWTNGQSFVSAEIHGASPFRLEGATDNNTYVTVTVTDPTAPRVLTIPNADSVTIQPQTCSSTDKVSAVSAAGVITCSADENSGGATKWNAIADADADGSVDFVATEQDIVGQLDSAGKSILTLTNQDADRANATTILSLHDYDIDDAQGVFMDMVADQDGTPTSIFKFVQDGATFTKDLTVPTEVYDATNWDGDNTVPTKDAVRDKIQSLSGGTLTSCITSNTSFAQTNYIAFGGGDANTTLANRDWTKLDRAITVTSITACVDTASGASGSWVAALNVAGSTSSTIKVTLNNVLCATASGLSEAVATSSLLAWEFVETGTASSTQGESICYSYTT